MSLRTSAGNWRNLLLTVHVGASAGVLGADLALLVLGVGGLVGQEPFAVYPAAHAIAAYAVQPLALAALASGLVLAVTSRWGLFTYWWTAIKLTIVLVLSGAVVFVLVPGLEKRAASAPGDAAIALAERLPLVLAPAVASTLLAVAIALAVFKPAWRIRRATPTLELERQ